METLELLYSESNIRDQLRILARQMIRDFPDGMFFVCVLKGASIFHADLIREISRQGGPKIHSEFLRAASYEGCKSTGVVNVYGGFEVKGRDVVVIEDIIDTGRTVARLKQEFVRQGARSVKVCALLDKACNKSKEKPDYCAFPDMPDHFVVGYGLDYDQHFRELPYIAIIHHIPGKR